MRWVTGFLILAGAFTLAACASQGPEPSTATGGSRHAAAGSATASGHVVPSGYHREVVNGEERFCRDDLDTGSRVQRTKVCLTWEELQAQERTNMQFYRGRSTAD